MGNFKERVAWGMHSNTDIPSLAHYLKTTNARFQLKLLPRQEESSFHTEAHFPFSTVRDSNPIASMMEASIVSDAGSVIRNVFILIQKDNYHFSTDASWPATNHDIDQAWQNLFTCLADSNKTDSVLILGDQVDDNGRFLPWSPLFYCQYKQIFFHPPCPQCGLPLKLCDDDALLTRMNLKPYATSLTRYLFCPHCNDTMNTSPFYVHTRGSSDSPTLKDRHDLIREFGRMVQDGNGKTDMPCLDCDRFQECYQGDHLSDSRIVAVSFYPFFMMTFNAPSMHVLDFLPLIAGANPEDVAHRLQTEGQGDRLNPIKNSNVPDWQDSLYFFNKGPKHFLEVLYLKLGLLGQLAQLAFAGQDKFKNPDLALSLDRFWVTLADHDDMTPFLWNFQVQFIGIGGDSGQPPSPHHSAQSHALSFLASCWFSVLFMNSRQDISQINSKIEHIVNLTASKHDLDHESRDELYQSHIFSPENIFWNPDHHRGGEDATQFLTQSLDLGFLLINNSLGATSQWSPADFWEKYKRITAEIKNALFTSERENRRARVLDDNQNIHDILVRIARKWQSGMETISPGPAHDAAGLSIEEEESDRASSVAPENDLIRQTVVLTPEMFRDAPSSHAISKDHPPETSRTMRDSALSSDAIDRELEGEEALPKTRIISQRVSEDRPVPPIESGNDDIPETVIISAHAHPASQEHAPLEPVVESTQSKEPPHTDRAAPEESTEDNPSPKPVIDDVPKTMIINYKKSQGGQ